MTRSLPLYQVDAFTTERFRGNPAAVMPLSEALPEALMQAIAAENNLSETAFIQRRPGAAVEYDIRWFTPALEVQLCGHATLASAAVVLERLEPTATRVTFHSMRGPLYVDKIDLPGGTPGYRLDFPRDVPDLIEDPALLAQVSEAFGVEAIALLCSPTASYRLIALVQDAATVEHAKPDLMKIAAIPHRSVSLTAAGDGAHADVDFVSRMFAPKAGITEDPVTGSLHCILTPYWAARLGKNVLRARQLSARRGELFVEDTGTRTLIGGGAVFVLEGVMQV
ncbi:MAG: PhzF family phenazine biosynthesis protein [Elstera sp.]